MSDSPDVKSYVDLTIFDEDEILVLNSILETARALLPEWDPQVGNIEVALAEAFAVRSTEIVRAINRVPSATTEVLLQLFGLTRSDGARASCVLDITFTDSDTIDRSLPAGTEFLYVDSVTGLSYIFELQEDFVLIGELSGLATVDAQVVGSAYNFSADGAALTMLSQESFFESATFNTSPAGGADPETDSEYFSRGVSLLASYTSAATTPNQIKFYVGANKTYAYRTGVFNRRRYRDRDTTAADYGLHNGAVLVAVASQVTNAASAAAEATVSSSNLNDLHVSLVDRVPAGLSVDVMSAELVEVDVSVSFAKDDGAITSEVSSAVQTALKDYLDPNVWDWDTNRVRVNDIVAVVSDVPGVRYVDGVSLNAKPLVGFENVGYYTEGGGSNASFTIDVNTNVNNQTWDVGQASVFYVDSSNATAIPTVYLFENEEFTTDGFGGADGVQYTAVATGLAYNDATRGGAVPDDYTTWSTVGGDWKYGEPPVSASVTFENVSVISGGSNDSEVFVPLNSDTDPAVTSDLVFKNLGTLAIYGSVTTTVV